MRRGNDRGEARHEIARSRRTTRGSRTARGARRVAERSYTREVSRDCRPPDDGISHERLRQARPLPQPRTLARAPRPHTGNGKVTPASPDPRARRPRGTPPPSRRRPRLRPLPEPLPFTRRRTPGAEPARSVDAVAEARAPSTRRDAFTLGRRALRGRTFKAASGSSGCGSNASSSQATTSRSSTRSRCRADLPGCVRGRYATRPSGKIERRSRLNGGRAP